MSICFKLSSQSIDECSAYHLIPVSDSQTNEGVNARDSIEMEDSLLACSLVHVFLVQGTEDTPTTLITIFERPAAWLIHPLLLRLEQPEDLLTIKSDPGMLLHAVLDGGKSSCHGPSDVQLRDLLQSSISIETWPRVSDGNS